MELYTYCFAFVYVMEQRGIPIVNTSFGEYSDYFVAFVVSKAFWKFTNMSNSGRIYFMVIPVSILLIKGGLLY